MLITRLVMAGAVLLLSHYNYSWIAVILVVAPVLYGWARRDRDLSYVLARTPDLIIGLSVVMLLGLRRPPYGQVVLPVSTQIIITLAYIVGLLWIQRLRSKSEVSLVVTALQQAASTTALFLAAAFWQWPEVLVVAGTWVAVFGSTHWYLTGRGERVAVIMSAAYALVAAEVAWVLYAWQVNYVLPGNVLIIPQTTLVLFGLGYCFASIYHSHKEKRLSRRRLVEFVVIAGALLAVVIAGTHWNGSA